jgi:hypothetical protein
MYAVITHDFASASLLLHHHHLLLLLLFFLLPLFHLLILLQLVVARYEAAISRFCIEAVWDEGGDVDHVVEALMNELLVDAVLDIGSAGRGERRGGVVNRNRY